MYTFTLLEESSIDMVMDLISRAIIYLNKRGIPQWDEVYPDIGTIRSDISSRTLHGFLDGERIVGILVLNEVQDPSYAGMNWKLQDDCPLILHRLCLDPDYQGKGLSKLMMKYVEEYAKSNGYRSVRLDAFMQNQISVGLYRSLGYSETGTVRFRKGMFYCFEKIMDQRILR